MQLRDLITEDVLEGAAEIDAFVQKHGPDLPSLNSTLRLVRDVSTDRLRTVGKDVWGTGGEGGADLVGNSFDNCIVELDRASTSAASWTGDGKNAYSQRLTKTKKALNDMREPSEDVGQGLVAIADAWDQKFGHSLADIITIIGVVVAIIGVIVAVVFFETGIGAVIGLVVAIIGLIIAVASFIVAENDKEQAKIDALNSAGQEAEETMTSANSTKP